MRRLSVLALLPLLISPALAGADAITAEGLASHIKVLASDEFAGRAPDGGLGEQKTLDYLVAQFKAMGLKPGNGKSYLQEVPLVSIAADPAARMRVSGGEGDILELKYLEDQLEWTRRVRTSVNLEESEMVFVGHGVNAPEEGWNDYAGVDMRGKTALMFVNEPGFFSNDESLFRGKALTYYGRWDYKFDEAARQGAVAAIIIHETKAASYPWQTVQASWSGPRFHLSRKDGGSGFAVIEAWVTREAAAKIFARAGLDYETQKAAAQKRGFKPVPLNLALSASIDNKVTKVTSHNVIAKIEGTEKPTEAFVYMAHWDHLGTKPEKAGDNIYNGALDNASGVAGILQIAKAFSADSAKPRRSVLFMAVTAEEQGLLGSEFYGDHPVLPFKDTVGGVNIDGLGIIGRTRDLTVVGFGNSELDEMLAAKAQPFGRHLAPDPEPENGSFYRSDHFNLSKQGVPMLFAGGGIDHAEKGKTYGQAMSDDYSAKHYHQPSDEYHESWDLSGGVEDMQLFYALGHDLANSDVWPKWTGGTEFKALRQRQGRP